MESKQVRAEIDRLARRYEQLVAGAKEPAERADAFRRLLFEEERFESIADLESAEHLHLDSVLRTRQGYCLSLSVVALAIAERVGAPLYGVAMPNHFLVRYDDGKFRCNLELTRKGATIELEKMPDTVYGRNLRPADVKAYLLHNRGYVSLLKKDRVKAREDFEAAIRIQPGFGEAHRNLGVVLGEQKRWAEAKKAFIRAIVINARDVNALVNLAICRWRLGEKKAALQDLELVLAIDPNRSSAQALRKRWTTPSRIQEPMPKPPKELKPGLRARYYAGMKFNRLGLERIDTEFDFDWQNNAPVKEVPRDRFSVRWEGYFKAPASGVYTFFVVANDGARLVVGETTLIDEWRGRGTQNLFAHQDLKLKAGWHKFRLEHFDVMGGARMMLRIGVEGREQPLDLKKHLFH
ncbi:MAG: transglutaminase family protein [Planctomycetota bacterium]